MIYRAMIVTVLWALVLTPVAARAEVPIARDPLAQNAALAYWQAFILMPKTDNGKDCDVDVPIDAESIKFVESGDTSIHQLQRAAKMDRCAWGAELEAGIDAQLPHLSQARKMARFACLRAKVRFSQDRPDDAIEELVAVMGLARHAGSDGLLISILVQYAIDGMAIELVAENLPTLKPELLDGLSRRIEDLPQGKSMSHAMRMEKILLLEWFIDEISKPGGREKILDMLEGQFEHLKGEEPAKFRTLSQQEIVDGLIELRAVYDNLIEAVKQPPNQVDEYAENLIEKLQLTGPAEMFASFLLPAIGKVRRSEASYQTQQVMLKAAVAVVKDGPSQLEQKELHDPFAQGPFEYAKTKGGFTLTSKLLDRKGEVVVLSVGPASDE